MLLVDRGYLGVDFFFLLSGFILAARHAEEFADGYSLATHIGFAIKRFGRLFPLHLVVLAAVLLGIHLRGEPQYWWTHIATEAALIHRWDIIRTPLAALNGPDWSISTEWAANLLFPVFVVATGFAGRSMLRPVVFGIAALSALIFVYVRHGSMDTGQANSSLPLIRCFAEFGLGMILFQRRSLFRTFSKDAGILAVGGIVLVGLYVCADLLVVVAMIPLLPMLALTTGMTSRLLSAGPLHFVGVISYSIYLIQLPIILEIDRLLAGSSWTAWLHWLLPPIAIVVMATVTYRVIEKPCNEGIRRLSRAASRSARARSDRTEAEG